MGQKDYPVGSLIQMDACTCCRLCVDVCPAVAATLDEHLSGIYRLDRMRRLMNARMGFLHRLLGKALSSKDELKQFGETVFRCTLCGRCEQVCPSGIRLTDLWLSLRMDLVHTAVHPRKVDRIGEHVGDSHNVFDEDNVERADWVEDMRDTPDHGYIRHPADVVYFTGCVASFYPLAQKIPKALAQILDAASVRFTLLGEAEWCCGFPLLGAGLKDRISGLIDHNIEAVRSTGARKVVFSCPSCYQMWREHYPAGTFELWHVTRFLRHLIADGRLVFSDIPLTVTYHDPCDLGRGSGEYDLPREIIRAIPGVRLVEMAHHREQCLCCGGGGNLEMIDAELSAKIAVAKIEEVLRTGAEAVVTACQQCVRTMTAHVRKNKISLEVMDVVELVQRAMIHKL